MRLPNTAHTSRPWRIHEIAGDFRLEDVWALPTPGQADEFPIFVEGFAAADPAKTRIGATRALCRCGGSSASCSAWTTRTRDSGRG